jgi:oligopeptide/dipeptide ABC transporter ATP-binding protein
MTVLQLDDLHTQFETKAGTVHAVDGVDMEIDEGQIVGLVGESGSGKSVLARSVMRLIEDPGRIASGDIRFQDESLLDRTETEMQEIRGNRISMIFQDPMNSLNPTISVGEQIAENIRLHQDVGESVSLPAEVKRKILGASKDTQSWRRAIEMLETVEIPEASSRAADYPHEFSGGMRQRAMIAMALSCEPDLLIADEPTTALDVTVQAQILEELHRLRDEFDVSILIITHDLAVAAETCDLINVMYAGEIVETAPTQALFDDPQHPYTQALLDSMPDIERTKDELTPIPGNVPDLIDMPDVCHFAPRCPEATEACLDRVPPLEPVEGTEPHRAACIYRGDGGGDEE